jgi:DNA-binding response OmpR family regulator
VTQILVVDDEPSLAQSISYTLRKEGYEVTTAGDGASAIDLARESHPDLIVLDVMLPGIDGLEVCRRVRRKSAVPILMLTARADEIDRIIGLEVGADDYLTKPFSMRELVARVRAMLRRYDMLREELRATQEEPRSETLEADDLRVDLRAHEVTIGDTRVPLTPKEFDLLVALVRNRGQVLSAARLLEMVWGYTDPDTRTVTVHIRSLRNKVEQDASHPSRIETIRGVGYRYIK